MLTGYLEINISTFDLTSQRFQTLMVSFLPQNPKYA